jgi:hypothetical protein
VLRVVVEYGPRVLPVAGRDSVLVGMSVEFVLPAVAAGPDGGAILADVDGGLAVLRPPNTRSDPDAQPAPRRPARPDGVHVRSPATRHHKE